MSRPHLCMNPDEAHALGWLTPDFCVCPVCGLLYALQSGSLVWVTDWNAQTLAAALCDQRLTAQLAELGISHKDLDELLRA